MRLAKTSGADQGGSEIKAEAGVDDTVHCKQGTIM